MKALELTASANGTWSIRFIDKTSTGTLEQCAEWLQAEVDLLDDTKDTLEFRQKYPDLHAPAFGLSFWQLKGTPEEITPEELFVALLAELPVTLDGYFFSGDTDGFGAESDPTFSFDNEYGVESGIEDLTIENVRAAHEARKNKVKLGMRPAEPDDDDFA